MAKLQQLADLVGGQVQGDPEIEISRVAPIDQAGPGDITFVTNPKYLPLLKQCRADAVIVSPDIAVQDGTFLVCRNPYLAFAKIQTSLMPDKARKGGVRGGATVADSAVIDPAATIYPGCVVGENVVIGSGSVLYPGVVIYDDVRIGRDCILHGQAVVREGCRLGDRVILQPSAVIGSDGFGFAPDGQTYFKIPQVGIVVLEDDVEIGACSCVDRAALGETVIRRGTKLDNLVQIGHNVQVGEDTVIVAQCGIAGSTKIGKHCTFGGQAAVAGHIRIGDNVTIGGRGGATGNVEGNQVLSGTPLMPHKQWLKASMSFAKLPEMRKEMQQLKKRLEEIESLLEEK